MTSHTYSDLNSFNRLMLLIAAIAQNPGIAPSESRNGGTNPMETLQAAMIAVATEQGIEYTPCSVHTLRKDVSNLKQWGILPPDALRAGYYIGRQPATAPRLAPIPRSRKTEERNNWIRQLRAKGATMQEIADAVELSRSRVEQILNP